MKDINKLRLLAGIPIDGKVEITEAREVPKRREHLDPVNEKTLSLRVKQTEAAIKHLTQTIKSLEKVPATDFAGDIQHYIEELEYVLAGDDQASGLTSLLNTYKKQQRKHIRNEKAKNRQEEEEVNSLLANAEDEETASEYEEVSESKKADKDYDGDGEIESEEDEHKGVVDKAIKKNKQKKKDVKESVHTYSDNYNDWEQDDTKPVNVSDGSANKEQVWDVNDPDDVTDESPNQLREPNKDSEQDQSTQDLEAKFKIPTGIKQSLRAEIDQARAEAKKLDVRDKDAAYFYTDLANAFEDLLGHLEKGTVYDFKQAQVFAQSFMGPMLHKLPTNVWKFLTNGGETRSLKSYMTDVSKKFPKTGPQNKLK